MDGRKTTKRGCAVIESNAKETCGKASNKQYDGCMLCEKDHCNQANVKITSSIILFFITFIVIQF